MNAPRVKVCVVGLWHLGCVYAACLAKLGYSVVGTDENPRTIEGLKRGKAPLFEPGLDDAITEAITTGNLSLVDRIEGASQRADYLVLAYDTPVDSEDQSDLSVLFRAVSALKRAGSSATLIVSSQVPVGTCEQIISHLSDREHVPAVAYVPENLVLGRAIECFMKPDMIVIGANNHSTISKVRMLFAPIATRIVQMDLRSAEMTKHALNAFLATSISFTNEIGNLCDLVGADGLKVAEALKCDSRIGTKARLRPGLGFAGGTLARELRALQSAGERQGYDTVLLNAVLTVNEMQNGSIVDRLKRLIGGVGQTTVAVFGLTYKAGTSTLRRSAALEIIRRLVSEGARVKAYDPEVSKAEVPSELFQLCDEPYEAVRDADALVVMHDWAMLAELDLKRICSMMKNPIVLDTQNVLDPTKVIDAGLRYAGIGRGASVLSG